MAQLIDPIPSYESDLICCCYVNRSTKMQIVRITNIPNWYFERVVFPTQQLLFESLPQGCLEIHTGMMASSILSDTIPCAQLKVNEDDIVLEPSYSAENERQQEVNNEFPNPLRSKSDSISLQESLKSSVAKVS